MNEPPDPSLASPPPLPPPSGAGPVPLRPALPWSPTGAVAFGWDTMKRNPMCILVLFVANLVGNFIAGIGGGINGVLSSRHDPALEAVGLAFYLGGILLGLPVAFWMQMGVTRYCIKLARGRPAGFEDVFTGGPYLSFLGAGLLVGLGVMGGTLLCIVPGILLALGWMIQAQLIVDRRLSALEAISTSWRLTTGHKGDLFLFVLVSIGVAFLGLLACCVGVFVATPILAIAHAYIYLKLTGEEPAVPAVPPPAA